MILHIILALALIIGSVGCVLFGGGLVKWIWQSQQQDKHTTFVDVTFFTTMGLLVMLLGAGLFTLFIKLLSGEGP